MIQRRGCIWKNGSVAAWKSGSLEPRKRIPINPPFRASS